MKGAGHFISSNILLMFPSNTVLSFILLLLQITRRNISSGISRKEIITLSSANAAQLLSLNFGQQRWRSIIVYLCCGI
jgi:hypothetical protein